MQTGRLAGTGARHAGGLSKGIVHDNRSIVQGGGKITPPGLGGQGDGVISPDSSRFLNYGTRTFKLNPHVAHRTASRTFRENRQEISNVRGWGGCAG
jgi:hypothetical protein